MSGKVVGMVFDHYEGRGAELLLAVKLADNAHDDGTHIFPGVETLARQTRQSARSVQYQIKRMLATGWLILVREAIGGGRGGGSGRPREYRIHPDFIKGHDSRVPESERPTWTPKPIELGNPSAQEMGADSAPISSGKWVQPGEEMGAIAVAEMGATAIAPEPSLTVKEPNTPLPPAGVEPGFKVFFAGYPRQVEEAKARSEWVKLAPDDSLQREIAASVARWRSTPEWQREEGRFVPKPANWLRHKRWRDMPGIAPAPRPVMPPAIPSPPSAPMPDSVRAYAASLLGPLQKVKKQKEANGAH